MEGKEFRKLRRLKDYTQQQIADYCNINKSTISRWENDKININENVLDKIERFAKENLTI